jgi:MFS family permease
VVSVALGDIQVSLKANVSDLQWVVGAYALTFASIMLACGMIGDELGRKKVMLAGVGVFCAGSVLCALAPNVQTLIAGRAVMGLGAAASEPGTLSMLRHLYPDARARNRAVGVWAATSGFALAAGPVVGGVLTGVWSWRGIFWFNLAFGLAALIVAAVILPESADPTASRVDTAGTILGAGALATFVFAIIDAESAGFGSAVVIILLCLSAVLFAAFGWWERRAPNPLLDLRYLRVPQLLRHLRHLLLHRAVPGRGGEHVRLPAGPHLPADDRADDRGVGAGRTLDGHGRTALVDHPRLRAAGRRPVLDRRRPVPEA